MALSSDGFILICLTVNALNQIREVILLPKKDFCLQMVADESYLSSFCVPVCVYWGLIHSVGEEDCMLKVEHMFTDLHMYNIIRVTRV